MLIATDRLPYSSPIPNAVTFERAVPRGSRAYAFELRYEIAPAAGLLVEVA
jgi:hypothetical protein